MKIPFISILKKPVCASKQDVLELGTLQYMLKSSRNKKDLIDVTAGPFLVSLSQLSAAKKNTKNRAALTSLRSFLFHDNFSWQLLWLHWAWVADLSNVHDRCRSQIDPDLQPTLLCKMYYICLYYHYVTFFITHLTFYLGTFTHAHSSWILKS